MNKLTFHLVGLPHTQVAKGKWGQCAFTAKIRKFANMMTDRGHDVYLYSSDLNEAKCKENIVCITKEQQDYFLGEEEWYKNGSIYMMPYDRKLPIWKLFNDNVTREIKKRIKPNDFILYTTGNTQQEIQKAFPNNKNVEFGIGYTGIWNTKYKIFESYAWMNYNYGRFTIPDYERPNYAVVPNYFEVDDFPASDKVEDYLLFMARPIPSKGLSYVMGLAADGNKVKVAGAVPVEGKNIEWVGYADEKKRGELMSHAKALLSVTLNVEPFGGVAVEAMLCGTPVIASRWGAFVETIEDGKTGFLVSDYNEIKEALKKVDSLDRKYIRERARRLYSTETVSKMYEDYFNRIH
jgi:glycosyltransferase involved in cell wall biosynthesis